MRNKQNSKKGLKIPKSGGFPALKGENNYGGVRVTRAGTATVRKNCNKF